MAVGDLSKLSQFDPHKIFYSVGKRSLENVVIVGARVEDNACFKGLLLDVLVIAA